jgi:hypothetical protein
MSETAVVYPPRGLGKDKETASLLLALADDINDVKTNTDNGFAFLVPQYLYELYLEALKPDVEPVLADQFKRRPGRPRKVQEVEGE